MRRSAVGSLLLISVLAACQDDVIFVDGDVPAAPRALAASYFARAVTVTWELAPAWNGEAFRVYSRRLTDSDFFFIAEVTSCDQGVCTYEDINITPGQTFVYIVAAVSASGTETDSENSVEVFIPEPIAPPIPDATRVIALDNANYLVWGNQSRSAADFSHYKVYLDDGIDPFLLGETDSEGFVDLLATNGNTFSYFLTAVDTDGHESDGSVLGEGTPRPDFTGELIYDFLDPDVTASSGFRFSEDELTLPIIDGAALGRHFRLETDVNGWWLVPGPFTTVTAGQPTTALKCGVAADADCVDLTVAPLLSAFGSGDVQLTTQESYVLRVIGDDGEFHFGVIRVDLLGFDQNDDPLMIFDWAYQLQPGNPNLVEAIGG